MAWAGTLKPAPTSGAESEENAPVDEEMAPGADDRSKSTPVRTKILQRASEYFVLPKWDYGARTGIGELGRVRITYWVVDPAGRTSQEVLRNWVDPDKTIMMTLEVAACRGNPDATWRYSEAFLFAYDGDLDRADASYREAFRSPLADANIPTQCEEFILGVLDTESERIWLHYCLGLINYRAKEDLQAARTDFRRFVEAADPQRFRRQIDAARSAITEIDDALVKAAAGQRVGPVEPKRQ